MIKSEKIKQLRDAVWESNPQQKKIHFFYKNYVPSPNSSIQPWITTTKKCVNKKKRNPWNMNLKV